MSIPWYRKLLYSLLTTCAFFLVLELALSIIGVQPITETEDPFVGFSSEIPLFVPLDDDPQLMTTAENKTPWFNPQTFRRQKPEGAYRIFCLGGSTTFGRPFRDATSYSGWLREYLNEADGSRKWEVINAGGVSYASYRVAAVMEELTQYEPDMFIVYSAQNEFLEWRTYDDMLTRDPTGMRIVSKLSKTRTWALMDRATKSFREPPPKPKRFVLPGEVDEMLNHTIGPSSYQRDPKWRAQVIAHYQRNLDRMVQLASQAGAKIVFVTPGSNLRSCSPFRSDPSENLSVEQSQAFLTHVNVAEEHARLGDFEGALREYEMAREIDNLHALLHFRIGSTQFELKRFDEARKSFELAIENDICPLRAVEEIVSSIRQTAKKNQLVLVDFQRELDRYCQDKYGHACLGDELFLDHVHPKIEGHRILGEQLFEALKTARVVGVDRVLTEAIKDSVARRIESGIDDLERGVALRNLSKVLHWAGKFEEAGPIALQALELIEKDFASLVVAADCLRETGDEDGSIPLYEEVLHQDVLYYPAHMRLGQIMAKRGELETAKQFLTTGLSIEPSVAFAQYELGRVHLGLKEYEAARKAFHESLQLAPTDVDTMYFLGRTYGALGKSKEAIKWLNAAVEFAPGDAQARNELGLIYLKEGDFDKALEAFDAALAIDPSYEEAAINREQALEKRKP